MSREEELESYATLAQKQYESEKIKNIQLENDYGKVSAFLPTKDQNMIEYQLDLKEEIDRIFHLLSGHILQKDNDGREIWVEPDDDRLKIFSDYGVKQIMNIISFYINRNVLLSNFDIETINWKVRDFGIELADLIFNRYEIFFHYPSPEELFETYKPIAHRKYPNITDKELYLKCVQWSKEELQNKCIHYPMICLQLIDSVHATYLRALGGKERESLRKFMHVSQSTNTNEMPQMQNQKRGLFGRIK